MGPLAAVRTLNAASGALFAQALLHGKLASLDWQEEKRRLLKMFVALQLGCALGACALLFIGALLLVLAWDTPYRAASIAMPALLAAGGTFYAWREVQALAAQGEKSFAASREEFAADAALLRIAL